jgi:hypothetical protein
MGTVAQWGHFAGEFLKFVQLIVIILPHFAQV